MKKIYFLFALILMSFTYVNAQTVDINFDATSFSPLPDPANGVNFGLGYMTWFDNPKDGNLGGYQFEGGWGIPDLVVDIDTGANTASLKPNRIGDTNIYWQSPGILEGNKIGEANFYIEDDALVGNIINFHGNVQSNTLDGSSLSFEFTHIAFIKVFASDYSSVVTQTYDLGTTGDFTITMDATAAAPGSHVQYGFTITGPNINSDASFDTDYANLGSIVITQPTMSVNDFNLNDVSVYPNPSNDVWNVKTNNTVINTVQVFDVLGKQVMTLTPKSTEVKIDASTLNTGLYIAKIATPSGVSNVRLIKN